MSSNPTRSVLTRPLLLLMAVATGLCAGGNYFNQPLLDSIASALGVGQATAAVTVTVAQVSYGLGLLFLVPLGDLLDRRRLSVALMLLAAGGQAIGGVAPSIGWLMVGTAMAGLFSVAAQVLVPFAATLAPPERRATAVGTVMSGLLIGILLARSVAGLLSGLGGWQTVYRVSAVAMVVIALALWRALPSSREQSGLGYGGILASMGRLVRDEPRLRTRSALGAVSFGSLGVVFATMAFLLASEPFGLTDVQIGLVGLAGVAGAVTASIAGRLADRGLVQVTTGVGALLLCASWGLFAVGGHVLVAFVAAMVVADMALQSVHVSNQSVIYALAPHARARVTSVYMTAYFVGGATGSALGTVAWSRHGWAGVCVLGLTLAAVTVALWLADTRVASRPGVTAGKLSE